MNRTLALGLVMLAGCVQQPAVESAAEAPLSHLGTLCQPAQPVANAARADSQQVSDLEDEIRAALAKRNERLSYERGKVNALIACNRPALSSRLP